MLRKTILMLATTFTAGLLFVNLYTSLIDAINWGSNIPASIQTARDYFRSANPGNFFRIFSPANQILSLLALVLCWRAGKNIRLYCVLALLFAIAADAMTFGYFYPRNEIMFNGPIGNTAAIQAAWSEWSAMNWLRSALVLTNLVFDFAALTLVIRREAQVQAVESAREI